MNDNRSIDDRRSDLESILYGYYIKYTNMQELVNFAFVDSNPADSIDVYIDVFDMLKQIYGRNIYAVKQYVVVTAVINLAAHIREYFRTRHRMYTRIFLVYAENDTNNHKQFYMGFGDDSYKSTIDFARNNEFIKSQLEMVKIIVGYINNVYFVEKHTMFPMFVYDNILKNDGMPAVIITKNTLAYQIPSLVKNVALFRPRKHNKEDTSFCVNTSNGLLQYYSKLTSYKTIENMQLINPQHLSLLMAMTGNPQFNVKGITNATVAVRLLYTSIANGDILNAHMTDIDYVYYVMPELSKYIDSTNFAFRYKALDLSYQYLLYTYMPEALDYSWMINLYDPDSVKYINDKYFFDNPLNLESL
jgi:hypothetical protein